MYAQIAKNIENCNAFTPKAEAPLAADIQKFMAMIADPSALSDEQKEELEAAVEIMVADMKISLDKAIGKTKTEELTKFNEGMQIFAAAPANFPVKLILRDKPVADPMKLQDKLVQHGILMLEIHFDDGDAYECVARLRKDSTQYISFVQKL